MRLIYGDIVTAAQEFERGQIHEQPSGRFKHAIKLTHRSTIVYTANRQHVEREDEVELRVLEWQRINASMHELRTGVSCGGDFQGAFAEIEAGERRFRKALANAREHSA